MSTGLSRLCVFLAAFLLSVTPAWAESPEEMVNRINSVALTVFPPGTRTYELFWIPEGDSAGSVANLADLLSAAKRERARWVIASDDPLALKGNLLGALKQSSRSRRVRTQIVVLSPLAGDDELVEAARRVGASLEFLLLPPASSS